MPYHVELRRSPKLAWSCNCPAGEEGAFCEHCVAVALEEAGPDVFDVLAALDDW